MTDIQQLVRLLQSDQPSIRRNACEQLIVLPVLTQDAINALIIVTHDSDVSVAKAAQRAIELHQFDIDISQDAIDALNVPIDTLNVPIDMHQQPLQDLPCDIEGKNFSSRAWAYIIDTLILAAADFAITVFVGIILGVIFAITGKEFEYAIDPLLHLVNLIMGLFNSALYFAIFERLYGATLGKVFLGMRVIMADGAPCSFSGALIRAALRYIDGLFFGIPAYISMKAPSYQRIGDKYAKTIVVDEKSPHIKQHRQWWQFLVASTIYLFLNLVVVVIFTLASIY